MKDKDKAPGGDPGGFRIHDELADHQLHRDHTEGRRYRKACDVGIDEISVARELLADGRYVTTPTGHLLRIIDGVALPVDFDSARAIAADLFGDHGRPYRKMRRALIQIAGGAHE